MVNDIMKTQWKYYGYTYKLYDVNPYTINVASFAIFSLTNLHWSISELLSFMMLNFFSNYI